MAAQTLHRAIHNMPKLFLRSHTWQLSACRARPQSLLPVSTGLCPQTSQQKCNFSLSPSNKMSFVSSWKERLGMKTLKYKRRDLQHAGMRLYLCCAELIDYDEFITDLKIEDTFSSWFRIIELHVWLLMVRLAEEGDAGLQVRSSLTEFLWQDVDKRSRKLGSGASSSARRESIKVLSAEFKLALFAYDEGMLSDDRVLAGALWRTFFQKQLITPTQLEIMVAYVRKQQLHLHKQEPGIILQSGLVTFLPLVGEDEDAENNRKLLDNILNRT